MELITRNTYVLPKTIRCNWCDEELELDLGEASSLDEFAARLAEADKRAGEIHRCSKKPTGAK